VKNIYNYKVFWIVIFTLLAIYPLCINTLYVNIFVGFLIFSLYAVSLNLLLGYCGLLSFGHAMFFGAGAYATALVLTHIQGFPIILSVLISGLAAGIFALSLSPLLVRVGGASFAMMTLAIAQLMYVFCLKFRTLTGGEDGITGFPIPPFKIQSVLTLDMTVPENFYYFCMIIVVASLWALWFFTRTPFGNIMVGVRDNPSRLEFLGFRVTISKGIVFIVSGFFAGIAGSLYTLFNNLVTPDDSLSLFNSIYPLMMAYIGGTGYFFGPIVGAAILEIFEELATRYTEHIELAKGLLLILTVLFMPYGFVGLCQRLSAKWLKNSSKHPKYWRILNGHFGNKTTGASVRRVSSPK